MTQLTNLSKMKYTLLLLNLFLSFFLFGQQTPAPKQDIPILVMGATTHIGNGEVIESSMVAFENGKFTIIGNIAMAQGFSDYKIIHANGLHLYPGLIALNTTIGLKEIDAVRATRDLDELGNINPNLNAAIAYNTDSRVTPTIRSNGVLLAQVTPQGGRISGQSSIMQLDAWNWEDALVKVKDGVHLNWPNYFSRKGWYGRKIEKSKNYQTLVTEIREYFEEAKSYNLTDNPKVKNLKFEAMKGLFLKSKKLYVHTNFVKAIKDAIHLFNKFDLKIVIVGGADAWRIPDLFVENDIPVILTQVNRLPSFPDEDIDQPYLTPKWLAEKNVLFAIANNGMWQQRNLPFHAGQAVNFGLDPERAIQAITLDAAEIIGIDKHFGSIEKGKSATFVICNGDILDIKSSKIRYAFINGREIDLDNKQKVLYRKYQQKYNQEIKK